MKSEIKELIEFLEECRTGEKDAGNYVWFFGQEVILVDDSGAEDHRCFSIPCLEMDKLVEYFAKNAGFAAVEYLFGGEE